MSRRRDHARRAQLRRRSCDLQRLQRLHLALPDRRDRQLARRSREAAPTRSTSSSAGTRCRRKARSRRATVDLPQHVARITAEASAGQGGVAPAPWSAAQPVVHLHTLARPAVATVTGNFPLTGDGASSDIRHIVLDFGATAFPVLEGQTDRHRAARRRRRRAGRTTCACTRSRARATASGRATTTSRSR